MVGSVNAVSRHKMADEIKNTGDKGIDKVLEKNVFKPIEDETKLASSMAGAGMAAAANHGGMINTVK